jgi:hypothetical protein
MVELNGHEAGNGGYSQGRPTACRVLLYSERCPVIGIYANYVMAQLTVMVKQREYTGISLDNNS